MKLKLMSIVAAALAMVCGQPRGRFVGRAQAQDNYTAFRFRMGAGFAGDVNRTHPAEIEPVLLDEDDTIARYGNMGIIDSVTHGLRGIVAGDASDSVALIPWGALVRPYPTQQQSSTNYGAASFGAATPPTSGVADVLRNGLIMVQLNEGVTDPVKGGRVFVWAAATSGDHHQGGYETQASSGNTVELDPRYLYNGGPDENGIVEISCNV